MILWSGDQASGISFKLLGFLHFPPSDLTLPFSLFRDQPLPETTFWGFRLDEVIQNEDGANGPDPDDLEEPPDGFVPPEPPSSP